LQVRVLSPLRSWRHRAAGTARRRPVRASFDHDRGDDLVTQTRSDAATTSQRSAVRAGRGPVARIGRFLREVVAELGKVIWPTRKELITYTSVVIVFVSIMVALVAGLDILFAKVVLLVFG
jgi:preprotein translocase subunit SecE